LYQKEREGGRKTEKKKVNRSVQGALTSILKTAGIYQACCGLLTIGSNSIRLASFAKLNNEAF
jgi:hypothetical protein